MTNKDSQDSIKKNFSIHLLVVFVGLSLSHSIKLLSKNKFSFDRFDKAFFMNSGAIVVALWINKMIVDKLEISLNKYKLNDSKENVFDNTRINIIKDIIETALVVTIPKITKGLINGTTISFDDKYYRYLFLSIAAVSLYNILFEPLINKLLGTKHPKLLIAKDITKKTTILAVSDYMADLELEDDFSKSALSTASGILLSEFARKPIAKLINK